MYYVMSSIKGVRTLLSHSAPRPFPFEGTNFALLLSCLHVRIHEMGVAYSFVMFVSCLEKIRSQFKKLKCR